MQSSSFRSLLATLPKHPSPDDLAPVAEELARACQGRAQPRKSLALFLRNAKDVAPAAVLRAISEQVIEMIERQITATPAAVPMLQAVWLDINEAARVLVLHRATLTERVKLPEYRYLYGWPYWDGHQWWFSPTALDPATRVEFLARLPKREPDAHVAMLPTWCVRQAAEQETPGASARTA